MLKKTKKPICYIKNKYKCANKTYIKNFKSLNNIIINVNKINVKNFVPYYSNSKLCFKVFNNNFIVKILSSTIYVECVKKSQISIILPVTNYNESYKVNSFGIKFNNWFVGFNKYAQVVVNKNSAKVFKTVFSKRLSINYSAMQITMQNFKNLRNNTKTSIINAHNYKLDLTNNAVAIKGEVNLKNIFNTKIYDKKHINCYTVVNGLYYVWKKENYTFISKKSSAKSVALNFGIKHYFSIKIATKNTKLNNYINNILPQKIVNEFKRNFNFQPFLLWLNFNKLNKKSCVFEYYNLLKNFGLQEFRNDKLYFCKPTCSNKYVNILVNGNLINLVNNNGKYSFLFNGVSYNNVECLKLSKHA